MSLAVGAPVKRTWHWSKQRVQALELLAAGDLTERDIADQIGISTRQLNRWIENEDFRARLAVETERIDQRIRNRGIARLIKRVEGYAERRDRLNKIISERAASPQMQNVPGGQTGLLVHEIKSVRVGEQWELVDEYTLDAALLRELREHEKQAAMELGQWIEHTEKLEKRFIAGNLTHQHTSLDLSKLPLELRSAILDWQRQQEEIANTPAPKQIENQTIQSEIVVGESQISTNGEMELTRTEEQSPAGAEQSSLILVTERNGESHLGNGQPK